MKEKIFGGTKFKKFLKVAYSFSRSFSSETHREKTTKWRKAIKRI